jgi:hypothetical protein
MAKHKKELHINDRVEKIHYYLSRMRYIDLQRECILRGIDFNLLVSSDINGLSQWLVRHWEDPAEPTRLNSFDDWRAKLLKERGIDEPFVKLGYVGKRDETTGVILAGKKPRLLTKIRKKAKSRNDALGGIFTGTKKELTFLCAKEGKDLEKTIEIVLEKFPEAVEKSIRIWYNKAKKLK